jgi:hypothetical protein
MWRKTQDMKIVTHLFALPELPEPNSLWAISYYIKKPDSEMLVHFSHGVKPETEISQADLQKLVLDKKAVPLPEKIELLGEDTLYIGTNGILWRATFAQNTRPQKRVEIGCYHLLRQEVELYY